MIEMFAQPLRRPKVLRPGARIAAISPSWGGPAVHPARFEAGKAQLEREFGVELVSMPHTHANSAWLAKNPMARAEDLMQAFADPGIDAVFAAIGGEDSIRLMPFLDLEIIANNPKVFLGFSDTTSLHFACLAAGLASFYGPSIMAGFAENAGMHALTRKSVAQTLFSTKPIGQIPANTEGWTAEHVPWADPTQQHKPRKLWPPTPVLALQGKGKAQGRLIGGCAEVLEMLKATPWWPPLEYWSGALLFFETSEDRPPPTFIRYWFRNYAAQGILHRINGILIARADPGSTPHYQETIEAEILGVLDEAGLSDLPVLSRLDFGHTQPMITLPYGVMAEMDTDPPRLSLLEPATMA